MFMGMFRSECGACYLKSLHSLGKYVLVKVKVKQSHYRPEQAQGVLRKLGFPDYMTTAQDGGKVVSLTHRPPLPQETFLVLISVRG